MKSSKSKTNTKPHQIRVSNITIDVVRKDIKNLHLDVNPPTGRVRIATPLQVDDEAVRLFAISKLAWIRKHQRNFESQERQTEREYVSGESHYFEGHRYLLNVTYRNEKPKVEIRNKTYIDLFMRPNSSRDQRERVMIKWYRTRLNEKVPALIEKWQSIIGVSVNGWQIRQMKTKWGTCNTKAQRILLNLELVKKPIHCLEFIVVHELVHILERHHNERFLALMDKFLPQWRFYQKKLNQLPLSNEDWKY